MRRSQARTIIHNIIYSTIGIIILFGDTASAIPRVDPLPEHLDTGTWLRVATAALLAVLIWIVKDTDATIKGHTKKLADLRNIPDIVDDHSERMEQYFITQLELKNRVVQTEKEIELLKHTTKNAESAIGIQRELLLTKYHDKEETDRHRTHIEETLRKQADMLAKISGQLENQQRNRP